MTRKRMSWGWVDEYPVFVYTTWITHNVFDVIVIKGTKGNQNDPAIDINTKPYMTYIERGLPSKDKVVEAAFERFKIREKRVI